MKARIATITLVTLFAVFALSAPGPVDQARAQQPTPPAPKEAPKGGKKVKQTAVITMEKGGEIAIEFSRRTRPRRWRTS